MSPNRRRAGPIPGTRPNVFVPTRTADSSTISRLDDIRPAQLEAWALACWHLDALGLPPLPPAHVAAALRRRGWWPASPSPDRLLSDTRTM